MRVGDIPFFSFMDRMGNEVGPGVSSPSLRASLAHVRPIALIKKRTPPPARTIAGASPPAAPFPPPFRGS